MGKQIFLLVGILSVICSRAARAEESTIQGQSSSTQAPAEPSPWKAKSTSTYWDFEGTHAAHDNLYSFGKLSVFKEGVSLSYLADGWSFAASGAYLNNYAETNVFGETFRDKTEGWGDTFLDASHALVSASGFTLFGDAGVSLPTGSIDKMNASVPGMHYAYFLELGSGTVDPEAGLTALAPRALSFMNAGAHAYTLQRTGWNHDGYRLGNLYKAEGWLDFPVGYGLTPRLTAAYKDKNGMHGADKTIGRNELVEYYYHSQVDWDVTAALKYEHSLFAGTGLVAEAGVPLAQGMKNVDGVDVDTNYYASVGVSGQF